MSIHRITRHNATQARPSALRFSWKVLFAWKVLFSWKVLLAWGALLSPVVDAAPMPVAPAPAAVAPAPTYTQCRQALERMDSRRFTHITQDTLALIYHDDPAYQAGNPVADGRPGPRTRQWLATFCGEFNITPPPNNNAFADTLLVSMSKVSELGQLFPYWRSHMSAPELLQWPMRQTIALLTAQADEDAPPPAATPLQYYALTGDDLRTLTAYSLNQPALEQWYQTPNLVAPDKETLARLTTLKDMPFADHYQWEVAMKLAGLSRLSPQDRQRIEAIARKDGVPTLATAPMVWRAPADCGCEDSTPNINGDDATFYGFYPYWQPLAEGQTLNFRQLDRIGYFSAAIVPATRGPQLVLPPNWRENRPYSDFIRLAHRYRTAIDLVVSSPRALSPSALAGLFTPSLVAQLSNSVQTPLDGWANRAKPWLTFGVSTRDTMADGVTLDVDLTPLAGRAGQLRFIRFVQALRNALTPAGHDDNAPPRYAINLMVPVESLLKQQGFYTLDNLQALLPYIDRFILQSDTPDGAGESRRTRDQLSDLRQFLSQQPQTGVAELYRKMVPVLITDANRRQPTELTELVRYSSWSFLSAAYWPLPLDDASQQLISRTYYPAASLPTPLAQLVSAANAVIDVVCPNRWVLRLILFITFWGIVVTGVVSLWLFPVRKVTESLWFAGFVVLFAATLMLALVADPYWQQYQTLILLLFAAVVVAIAMLQRVRKTRRERNP
ncbi:hypothetical protein [Dickeya chrysanthemi]|uniref:hypothetical protein n=1 Tax=Dickeya chrysanthemi TaxID=556 RepID=UPI001CF19754|nr:hypothetical protein [Dickeya chrysanthemi]MCA7006726.1 hypothetical protein [Dickeya chrysanthemi]